MVFTPRSAHRVLLVSADDTALHGLSQYFADAGVEVDRCSSLVPLVGLHEAVRAVVMLPDEFDQGDVLNFLATEGVRYPDLAIVVVTRSPARYDAMMEADGKPLGAIVLPWLEHPWTGLDALRASLRRR